MHFTDILFIESIVLVFILFIIEARRMKQEAR